MPPACLKQAFRIVALDRGGSHSRSKRSRSNVPSKYASARRFFARLASEIFLISLQTVFINNLTKGRSFGFQCPMECVGAYGMETREGPEPVIQLLQKLFDAGCQLLGGEWL